MTWYTGYGFGFDEEVPMGFQDADIEMADMIREAAEQEYERQADDSRYITDCDNFQALFATFNTCMNCNHHREDHRI